MNSYEEKQQARKERYLERARMAEQQGKGRINTARKMASAIPFGQPILVGHHSEKRDRNYRNRIHGNYEKGYQEFEKAEHYRQKAEAIDNNNAISSDDPDAIKKLKAKLEKLEGQRTKIKEHNKQARKDGTDPHPSYMLQNLGSNIRTVKQRIKFLEARKGKKTVEIKIKDVRIVSNVEANRVQIFFPYIPEPELRTRLKQRGFRWSRHNKCWQRHLNRYAVKLAKDIVEEVR